ncbi:fluoride efflux transporter FluC [Dietzia sp.]|uniref:fluoride efflux transporter FluC n=1 Tax=Dietzia sp. TaxID=1871616 RepID=UPI002FD8DACF
MTALVVIIAAALGGALRYVLDAGIKKAVRPVGPAGILAVNVLGSAALGLATGLFVAGSIARPEWSATAAFCGGFTTFSSAAVEVAYLLRARRWVRAIAYWFGMAVLCSGAAWAAYSLVA